MRKHVQRDLHFDNINNDSSSTFDNINGFNSGIQNLRIIITCVDPLTLKSDIENDTITNK